MSTFVKNCFIPNEYKRLARKLLVTLMVCALAFLRVDYTLRRRALMSSLDRCAATRCATPCSRIEFRAQFAVTELPIGFARNLRATGQTLGAD
jgi:hypothetical protein